MGSAGQASPKSRKRLGRYELLARLATGGMGEIFLARLEGAQGFEKIYVIKRILAHLADDARFRQMLIAEAQISSKMSHPNICQVFELGETDTQLYIVMEYLEGVSLLQLMRRFSKQLPLELGFIAGVFQQTADAMNYAHELKDREGNPLGIVHRDVTPSNVFVTETGVAKVLDFGIAKARGASTQTQEGTVKGKYAYMAPEQLRGGALDRRADIFAMGIVLYELLALRRLFQRKTDYLTFRAVIEQPIPDIRRYRPDIPDGVADALLRALDRERDNRFDTARQFGTAVLDGLAERPWTQGEIGDFIQLHFADQLGKRSKQVSSVIGADEMVRATTMPMLAQPDEGQHEGDADDELFPSVETEVDGAPPWLPRPPSSSPAAQRGVAADFASSTSSVTPLPFGIEPTGSLPGLLPLPGTIQPAPAPGAQSVVVVQQPRRSLVWPLLAFAMVVIAGGALLMVWQQLQHQQGQRPPEIKIIQERVGGTAPETPGSAGSDSSPGSNVNPRRPGPPPPSTTTDAGTSRPDAGSDVRTTPPGPKPKRASNYGEAIQQAVIAKKPEMTRCLEDHRDAIPKAALTAKITIQPSGKARSVRLVPEAVDQSELGRCLRAVLMTGAYPTSSEEREVSIGLSAGQT